MKNVISTDKAPAAIGPYSQAIEVNGMVYTSGVIPVSMDNVVKTTVFIKEMNDFGAINEVYATFFNGAYPARSCVEVARLPKDVMLEVEAIAVK